MDKKFNEILTYILVFIILISLGFLIFKYVKLPGEKTNEVINTELPQVTGVNGRLVFIDNNSIKVNIGKENVAVKLDANTIYTKLYEDPVASKEVSVSIGDFIVGDTVDVVFTSESEGTNLIAKSINKAANSFRAGNIISINDDKIIISEYITKEKSEFGLNDKTTYYRQSDAKLGGEESLRPKVINFNDIKKDDFIVVFYLDSTMAEKILLVPQK